MTDILTLNTIKKLIKGRLINGRFINIKCGK